MCHVIAISEKKLSKKQQGIKRVEIKGMKNLELSTTPKIKFLAKDQPHFESLLKACKIAHPTAKELLLN